MKNYGLRTLGVCWLLLLPLHAAAQTTSSQPAEARPAATPELESKAKTTAPAKPGSSELVVELGASYDALSSGNADWQSYFLGISRKFTSGQTLYGSASIVRRFDLTDQYLMIGLVQPLDESRRWSATFEAAGSPRHQVLPQVSFYGQLERNLGAGWLAHAGLRHSRYSADNVNIGVFGVERYFSKYRAAYTLYLSHLEGAGTSGSHAFQGNYYYGERNSVGAGVAFGEEVESLGGGNLLRTEVRSLSLNGRHWIDQKWGFSYVAGWHRQGTLYTRSTAQIALLRRF